MTQTQTRKLPDSINPLERGAEELLGRRSQSYWAGIWSQVRKSTTAVIALAVLAVFAFLAVAAPLLANHRPYILVTPEDTTFPLFRSLRTVDWAMLLGSIALLWTALWYPRIKRRGGVAGRVPLALYVLLSLTPVPLALWMTDFQRLPQLATAWYRFWTIDWWKFIIWWAPVVGGLLGLYWLARGAWIVAVGRRDQFGRDLTGPAMRRLFLGTLLITVGAAQLGTINRPLLDTTDYFKLAHDENNWALLPPIPHDYKGQESYLRNQPPLSPRLRVIASGGSEAAADLKLSDEALARGDRLVDDVAGPLSLETPVSALRKGQGLRQHSSRRPDLIVVTHDLSTTRVSLHGVETIGDVIDRFNEEAVNPRTKEPLFRVGLDPDSGLVFEDLTPRRPIHWFGTEDGGADVLARLIIATRVAMSIGFVSTGIAIAIGITVGALMGYFGGWVDILGMRIIEIFMAVPRLFLLLTIIAFIPPEWGQYMLYAMMAVIGLTSWMGAARFVRAEFFRLREMDFISAARAAGLPLRSILFKHMLPNGVTPVLVDASFGVAAGIFIETGLSYLGFGIKPPEPSWGQMLNLAIDPSSGVFHWWLAVFPGIMIFLTVFSFNIIGDTLRDAIDPRLKKESAL